MKVNIGLLWHSLNSDNLGVGALSISHLSIIDCAAERAGVPVKYFILGTQGSMPPVDVGKSIEIIPFNGLKDVLINSSLFMKTIKKCDCVLDLSEGDSFSDIYGEKRFLMHSLSKKMVLFSKCPLILAPQTIGPFNKKINSLFAKGIIKKCQKVFARDCLSMGLLNSFRNSIDSDEAIDVAFRLPYTKRKKNTNKFQIGINVSSLMFHGGYNRSNQFGLSINYKELIFTLIQKLILLENVEVILIPHVLSKDFEVEDDFAVNLILKEQFPEVTLAERFVSSIQAKSFISGLDFFIGARMHACIAAFSSGVPVIPTAYSRKFSGLFRSLDYDFIADCQSSNINDIINTILNGIEMVDVLQKKVIEGNIIATKKLQKYEDYLVSFFEGNFL